MLLNPALEKLQALKLTGMSEALDEQLRSPDIDQLAFEERLGLMVDREITARDNRRLKTRLKKARLRQNACLEDIAYSGLNERRLWLRQAKPENVGGSMN